MTKKEKIKAVADLKKAVVEYVIYKKKYSYYRGTDKKVKDKYSHNFNVYCTSRKQSDFKKVIKSEITKFFKSQCIKCTCEKYDRKDPMKIVMTAQNMTITGNTVDKTHYRIRIDYEY